MKKLVSVKQSKLSAFKKMNVEAEQAKSRNEDLDDEFQKKYAYWIVGMEKLNRDILDHLSQLQTFAKELSSDPNVLGSLAPSYMREKCKELAVQMVEKNNCDVHEARMMKLITNLTTVMWVTSYLNNNDQYGSVLNVLETGLFETKSSLDPSNEPAFQKHVESHIRHIQLGLHKKMMPMSRQKAIAATGSSQKSSKPKKALQLPRHFDEDIIINTPDSADPDIIDPIPVEEEELERLNRSAQEAAEDEEDDEENYDNESVGGLMKGEKIEDPLGGDDENSELLLGD